VNWCGMWSLSETPKATGMRLKRKSARGNDNDEGQLGLHLPACGSVSAFYFSAAARRCASDAASVDGFSLATWS
jgi:hypothetical protein